MTDLSIPKRATSTVIVGTVEDLDSLAESVRALLERDHKPSWRLSLPGYGGVRARGALADSAGALDMSKMRGFDLWLGGQFDDRHATITVDRVGIRADVWGESEKWSRESAVRIRHYLENLRPWWWWLRTWAGASTLSASLLVLSASVLGLVLVATGGAFTITALFWAALASGVGASLLTVFVVPTLKVGERAPAARVFVPLALWALGLVVSTVFGVYVGLGMSSAPSPTP